MILPVPCSAKTNKWKMMAEQVIKQRGRWNLVYATLKTYLGRFSLAHYIHNCIVCDKVLTLYNLQRDI